MQTNRNQRNVAVSFRISPELLAQVEALATLGLTRSDILKRGLEQGVDAGKDFKEGYVAALTACLGLFEEGSDAWNAVCTVIPE